ncbi:hypothetical protein SAY87_025189 [Trapa incisa]|uniref:S-adenosyl-L-methionine-dependent methyltransferase n=2 Tax=Trapa TaxID=22665 RepID=A0AAN7R4Z7_TRANT|nr:hypothetical protein SAY87_025189 [Trapa incisa]KAK4788435.1 hypothetical protein SAY86_019754 [Trapa natans]
MESLARFASLSPIAVPLPSPFRGSRRLRRGGVLRAELSNEGTDPLLISAMDAAALRFQETNRPEPLLVDPYAGCFVTSDFEIKSMKQSPHYCLSTRYIDDKLVSTVNHTDALKQVVLLTDGMDTRPYRLKWPYLTLIFDISPERVFKVANERLKDAGAKVPQTCVFLHVPWEPSKIEETLYTKGFSGTRPSIWAIQGFPVMTMANFEEILDLVGHMAMEGSYFLGELPAWLAETEIGKKTELSSWMDNIFTRHNFKVKIINYDKIAKNLGRQPTSENYGNILFIAENLRLSDGQMEIWRRTARRIEEDGDEDGFEEL